jgi:hypothetical protein
MNSDSLPSPIAMARVIAAVAALPSARFAGFTYRSKESGELARHVLILGASYENTLKSSIDALNVILPTLSGVEAVAGVELAQSLAKSLACLVTGTKNSDYTKADTYAPVKDANGNEVAGMKVHKLDGTLEVAGLAHSKVVLEAGTFKAVKSSDKTIAKAKLRRLLPIGKYRTLALDACALESLRISGSEIDFA